MWGGKFDNIKNTWSSWPCIQRTICNDNLQPEKFVQKDCFLDHLGIPPSVDDAINKLEDFLKDNPVKDLGYVQSSFENIQNLTGTNRLLKSSLG